MAELKSTLNRAGRYAARVREQYGLAARVRELEAELVEARQLNRRVAELTDVVTELLVPLTRRDDAGVDAVLARYRRII